MRASNSLGIRNTAIRVIAQDTVYFVHRHKQRNAFSIYKTLLGMSRQSRAMIISRNQHFVAYRDSHVNGLSKAHCSPPKTRGLGYGHRINAGKLSSQHNGDAEVEKKRTTTFYEE